MKDDAAIQAEVEKAIERRIAKGMSRADAVNEWMKGLDQEIAGEKIAAIGESFLDHFSADGKELLERSVAALPGHQKPKRFRARVMLLMAMVYQHAYNEGARSGQRSSDNLIPKIE